MRVLPLVEASEVSLSADLELLTKFGVVGFFEMEDLGLKVLAELAV
jgi:hypothetical protein